MTGRRPRSARRRTARAGLTTRAARSACAGLAAALVAVTWAPPPLAPVIPVAAQDACAADIEPNDEPGVGPVFVAPACIGGQLAGEDTQDLWTWDIGPEDAAVPWSVTLDGVDGAATSLRLLPVESEPGVLPPTLGSAILELAVPPDGSEPMRLESRFLPAGRYVLAVFRSEFDRQLPTGTGYRFDVEPGEPLPPAGDREPNDDPATAVPVSDAFALSGDQAETTDVYAWNVTPAAPGDRWLIELRGQVGTHASVELRDTANRTLVMTDAGRSGLARLPDLALAPGVYPIVVSSQGPGQRPYVLSARRVAADDPGTGDAEPNDVVQDALPLTFGTLVSGRLGHPGDRDAYLLDLDLGSAARQLDIKLLAPAGPDRTLCLAPVVEGSAGSDVQCVSAGRTVALRDLLLAPGTYRIEVRGEADPDAPYHLRVDSTTAPAPDYETEPNDVGLLATAMDAATVMRGRLQPTDRDTYRVRVSGDLQLWEAHLEGAANAVLSWVKPDGTQLGQNAYASESGTTLTDLLLVPGEHWFQVQGDGVYRLRFAPIGPPDPGAEREPNDDATFGEPLLIGQERSGRLGIPTDRDVSRFSLAAAEHVRVHLEPPPDAGLELGIFDAGGTIATQYAGEPGKPVNWEAFLPAGDYQLWISSRSGVMGRYRLRVDRLDPFLVPPGVEPNDSVAIAMPMPGTLRTGGSVSDSDDDWYVLPALPAEGSLTFRLEGDARLLANDGIGDLALTAGTEAGTSATDILPAGTVVRLRVSGRGPYALAVEPGMTGLAVEPEPPAAAHAVDVVLGPQVPAAWWPEGQRLEGTVTLSNSGDELLHLRLEGVSSHPVFAVELPGAPVAVEPGASVEVPLAVAVTPDAWADIPVRISVRATAPDGSFATGFAEVTPGREVEPVRAGTVWPLPDALLGGLDVASTALGGSVVVTWDAAGEERLHDGIAPADGGLQLAYPALPLTLTVDLAGDTPVPVAGTIIDAASAGVFPGEAPRAFALLLSQDGVTYQEVLAGELSAQPGGQAFALPEIVPARFAQLRIDSTWRATGRLTLGEWAVVAQPGTVTASLAAGANLGDPALGGHVAWISPQLYSQTLADALLTDDGLGEQPWLEAGVRPAFAIGFQDARAAQVERLEWVSQPGAAPARLIPRVSVAVSLDGAAGPWRDVGEWTLAQADDGTIAPFVFAEPLPARYVRLTGEPREAEDYLYLPATVRVIERPTDAGYRSVLGEWGGGTSGPLEWLAATAPGGPEPAVPDAPDVKEEAVTLPAGEVARGSAHRGRDVDWYALEVPPGHQSMRLTLRGVPVVGTALTLVDAEGTTVPTVRAPGASPGSLEYAADVTPGQSYRVRVEQPPFSAVVAYDTSMSMGPYLPVVYGALRTYAGGVEEGAEAVLIQPFDEEPLLEEWSDQRFVLEDAVNRYVNLGSSSSAETGLIDAIEALWVRPGTRAVLLMTDADTTSYDRNEELWSQLSVVRPVVYAVHVATGLPEPRHFMQDWAAVGGGYYDYARSHAEVERAFDRMATRLRRPAEYALTFETSTEPLPPPEPARLSVVAAEGAQGAAAAAPGPGVAVALVLDTSGSMLERFGGRRRIDVAREALARLVTEGLPAGTPVSLRAFRQAPKSCDTELLVPLGPLDPPAMASLVADLEVRKSVRTPLAAAIEAVAGDLAGVTGPRVVVVVSDGQESCEGDPDGAVEALRAAGFDITVNIVGLDLDRRTRKLMSRLAEVGNGTYFDARDPEQLARAITAAVSAPFQVFDAAGRLVAGGTVGGAAVELPPGVYRVVVAGDPPRTYEDVLLEPGGQLTLSPMADA